MLLPLLACVTAAPAPALLPPADPSPADPSPADGVPALPAGALPESDLPFGGTGRWELDGHVLTLEQATLSADGAPLIAGVYDDPAAGPDALWVPADPGGGDGGIYAVRADGGALRVTALLTGGRPDRLVLAPDGETLVYVAGTTGITSVWRVPTAGGAPRQLTNVGIGRPLVPGRRPAGFVPPFGRAPPRFAGDHLRWDAEAVEQEVRWR